LEPVKQHLVGVTNWDKQIFVGDDTLIMPGYAYVSF
jgi:hypothetical protein